MSKCATCETQIGHIRDPKGSQIRAFSENCQLRYVGISMISNHTDKMITAMILAYFNTFQPLPGLAEVVYTQLAQLWQEMTKLQSIQGGLEVRHGAMSLLGWGHVSRWDAADVKYHCSTANFTTETSMDRRSRWFEDGS